MTEFGIVGWVGSAENKECVHAAIVEMELPQAFLTLVRTQYGNKISIQELFTVLSLRYSELKDLKSKYFYFTSGRCNGLLGISKFTLCRFCFTAISCDKNPLTFKKKNFDRIDFDYHHLDWIATVPQ